ncbi:MAG: hypothetical protein R3B41_01440 [Candidatus Doudnabacteria bacterium]
MDQFNYFGANVISLFLIIAGFVIGLGAVTVIDWLGFLGQKSSYWTLATIRAHRVTKPLIWLGITLLSIGTYLSWQLGILGRFGLERGLLIIMLIINGLYLSFVISPQLLKREASNQAEQILPNQIQRRVMLSFIISFFGWWFGLLLFVVSLVARTIKWF